MSPIIAFSVLFFFLLVLALSSPLRYLSIALPVAAVIGQITVAQSLSLERFVIAAGGGAAVLVALGRNERRLFPERVVMLAVVTWLLAYSVALVNQPSAAGLSRYMSILQKVAYGWLAYLTLSFLPLRRRVENLFIAGVGLGAIVALLIVAREGNLTYMRVSAYDLTRGAEGFLRGLGRAGVGFNATLAGCLSLLRYRQSVFAHRGRPIWILVALSFFAMSMLALRRESLLAILLSTVAMLAFGFERMRVRGLVVVVLILLAVGYSVAYSPEWQQRLFGETAASLRTGRDSRWELLQFSWAAALRSPLLGHGPGRYIATQLEIPEGAVMRYRGKESAHNSFAAAAVEAGFGAMLGLTVLVFAVGVPFARRPPAQPPGTSLEAQWRFAPAVWVIIFMGLFFGDGAFTTASWMWLAWLASLKEIAQAQSTSLRSDLSWQVAPPPGLTRSYPEVRRSWSC